MTPVVPSVVTLVTCGPPSCGSGLLAVGEKRTPRSVMVALPSEVTVPPSVAEVGVTAALLAKNRLGGTGPKPGAWMTKVVLMGAGAAGAAERRRANAASRPATRGTWS